MVKYKPEENPVCIYCQVRSGVTEDHVFGRAFFGAIQPEFAMKVPACRECNQDCGDGSSRPMSLDEEWVRTLFAFIGAPHHPSAARLLNEEVRRSFLKSPKMKTAFEQKALRVNLQGETDIFRATVVAVNIEPEDLRRVNRVVGKMAKGLSYTYSEVRWPHPCPLPVDMGIRAHRLSPRTFVTLNKVFDATPRNGAWTSMGSEGAIRYRAVSESRTSHHVAWMMLFYNCMPFLAYAGPHDTSAIDFLKACGEGASLNHSKRDA